MSHDFPPDPRQPVHPVRPPQRVFGPDEFEKALFDAFHIPNCQRAPDYQTAYGAWLDRDCPSTDAST